MGLATRKVSFKVFYFGNHLFGNSTIYYHFFFAFQKITRQLLWGTERCAPICFRWVGAGANPNLEIAALSAVVISSTSSVVKCENSSVQISELNGRPNFYAIFCTEITGILLFGGFNFGATDDRATTRYRLSKGNVTQLASEVK